MFYIIRWKWHDNDTLYTYTVYNTLIAVVDWIKNNTYVLYTIYKIDTEKGTCEEMR